MALLINGQHVDDSVLGTEFGNIKSYFERLGNVSCCERDEEFRGYARQNVIARVLLAQEAMATEEALPEAEVDAAMEKLKATHGGEGQMLAALGAMPEHLPLIRKDLETNLRVEKMIDKLLPHAQLDEAEVRRFYDENIGQFMRTERVRAMHISKSARGDNRGKIYDEYREVRRKLTAGADFEELAREHSDRGKDLIDLGFFGRGELPEEFEMVAFSMNVGEISPVFVSTAGFHIVKVTGREDPAPRPFEEAREDAVKMLLEQRRQERVRVLVAELEKKAKIEDIKDPEPDYSEPVVHEHQSVTEGAT